MALFEINNLSVHAETDDGKKEVQLLKDVTLALEHGQKSALMGPSGSSKTTLANAAMGFLKKDLVCDGGTVCFDGIENVPKQISFEMIGNDPFEEIRGRRLGYVMQNVKEAFDPTVRIGRQIEEIFPDAERSQKKQMAISLLERAGTGDVQKTYRSYPSALSEGTLQKIMIFMALERNPEMVIMDEPFSALDALSVQAMIREIQKHQEMSILLITHDAEIAKQLCHSCWFLTEGKLSEETDLSLLTEADIANRMEI